MKRETPEPDERTQPRLIVIVGHTAKSPGAVMANGVHEYGYNSDVAAKMEAFAPSYGVGVDIVFRDQIGIAGAYRKAMRLQPDAIIELHFNAFNRQVTGTETLCTTDPHDKIFSAYMHKAACRAFRRLDNSRGVKPLPRSARGGGNIYSAPGVPNCLLEPFFGDAESDKAMKFWRAYAEGLVAAFQHYMQGRLGA